MKRSLMLIPVIAGILLSNACSKRIEPGHVGIVVNSYGNQRGVSDFPATTGTVWYNPWTTTVLQYPTFVQTAKWTKDVNEGKPVNEQITFTNKDNMLIAVDVSLSYSLLPEKVPHFYVKFRNDDLAAFTHGILRNQARDCFNENAGQYTIDQIMGDNAAFISSVRKCVQSQTEGVGVQLEQFGLIGAPRPPQQVIDSINLKAQAQQITYQKQIEVAQAEADAKKRVADAEGYAKAGIIEAEAQAKANAILAASITPTLVQYETVKKWNGALPTYSGGGTPIISLPGNK